MRHHQDNANTVIGQASTMKTLFDQGAEDLRVKLNGVIDELLATTGAQQIGIDPARGLGNTLADALTNIKNYMNLGASSISAEVIGTGSGDNVQAQLLWLKNQIQTMVLGQIPEASITLDKLAIELANKINSTDGIGDLTALTTAEKTNLVGAVNEVKTEFDSHLAQIVSDVSKGLANYNQFASAKDTNGIYTVVDYKRANNTLYMKSTLSNADTNGNYQTMTWQFYADDGTTVTDTKVWTISYDADGNVLSKVVV